MSLKIRFNILNGVQICNYLKLLLSLLTKFPQFALVIFVVFVNVKNINDVIVSIALGDECDYFCVCTARSTEFDYIQVSYLFVNIPIRRRSFLRDVPELRQ